MDEGKDQDTSWIPRNGHYRDRYPPRYRQNEGLKQQWGTAKKMASAKAQVNDKRLVASVAGEEDYRGKPPDDPDLIRARVVLAPHYSVYPFGFYFPETLDDIRKQHQVWITAVKGTEAFDIYSESASQLQEAIDAFNQLVHDLRLSHQLLATVLVVQKCSRATEDTRISLRVGSRPEVMTPLTGSPDLSVTAADLLQNLRPHLLNATECLMTVSSELRMRASFGILIPIMREKDPGNVLTYDQFIDAAKRYSTRGGIGLHHRFDELRLPNHIINHLLALEGDGGLRLDHKTKRRTYSLTLRLDQREIWLEDPEDGKFALPRAKTGKVFPTSWLNWGMAAPDMRFDWGLRADSYNFESAPANLHSLIKELELRPATYEDTGDFLKPSEVIVGQPGEWKDEVTETRLKTSFIAEFHDTPYVLQISMTQIWKRLRTKSRAKIVWGIELYGKHWDSAMNQVDPLTQRKDWGEGYRNVWVGADPDLGKRFLSFLEVFLQLQKLVEDVPRLTDEDSEDDPSGANE